MGLKIKRAKNKKGYRKNFFMVYRVPWKDTPVEQELYDYPVRGTPPANLSIRDKGDDTYERSKAVAMEYFKNWKSTQAIKGGTEALMEKLIASKLGKEEIEYTKISELYDKWCSIHQDRQPTEERQAQAKLDFEAFAKFLKKKNFLYEITEEDVHSFHRRLRKKYAPATVRDKMSLLRGMVGRYLPEGLKNPFKTISSRSKNPADDRVAHQPLSMDQYEKVLAEAARNEDGMILDLATGCGETGMRIKDVCLLTWDDVNLKEDMIKCTTHKTGTKVAIPISKELKTRLLIAESARTIESDYVWPEAATMYEHNQSGITYRGKMLFARALFSHVDEGPEIVLVENGAPKKMTILNAEALIKGSKYQDRKKAKVIRVLWGRHYGKSVVEIARDEGLTKGQVSEYLKEVYEDFQIDYRPKITSGIRTRKMLQMTRQRRKVGINSGCIYGWHSFRTSFVVKAALTWKLPLEIIKMIVGHKDTETTMRYYLNPTDPIMREIKKKMDADTEARAKFQIVHEAAPTPLTASPRPMIAEGGTEASRISLPEILKGLTPEAKAKIKNLPAEAKEEFKTLATIEDAEAYLALY